MGLEFVTNKLEEMKQDNMSESSSQTIKTEVVVTSIEPAKPNRSIRTKGQRVKTTKEALRTLVRNGAKKDSSEVAPFIAKLKGLEVDDEEIMKLLRN